MGAPALKKFERPQVERKWLTSEQAIKVYTYVPKDSPLPGMCTTENGPDPVAYVKIFDPSGSWTWYLLEADRETGEAFGLVHGYEKELGYIDLNELASVRGALGLPLERDIHWTPKKLSEIE